MLIKLRVVVRKYKAELWISNGEVYYYYWRTCGIGISRRWEVVDTCYDVIAESVGESGDLDSKQRA